MAPGKVKQDAMVVQPTEVDQNDFVKKEDDKNETPDTNQESEQNFAQISPGKCQMRLMSRIVQISQGNCCCFAE